MCVLYSETEKKWSFNALALSMSSAKIVSFLCKGEIALKSFHLDLIYDQNLLVGL